MRVRHRRQNGGQVFLLFLFLQFFWVNICFVSQITDYVRPSLHQSWRPCMCTARTKIVTLRTLKIRCQLFDKKRPNGCMGTYRQRITMHTSTLSYIVFVYSSVTDQWSWLSEAANWMRSLSVQVYRKQRPSPETWFISQNVDKIE